MTRRVYRLQNQLLTSTYNTGPDGIVQVDPKPTENGGPSGHGAGKGCALIELDWFKGKITGLSPMFKNQNM